MRYYVIGDDGQKYGPADIATLNSWIAEGRLLPVQQLEDETSGLRLAAGAVQGLNFPVRVEQPYAPQNPYQGAYSRGPVGVSSDIGQTELTISWVLFGVGFACTCLGPILWTIGIVLANKALEKGNPGGQAAKIANMILAVLGWIGVVCYILLIAYMATNGGPNRFH